jgi:hypothetical protein
MSFSDDFLNVLGALINGTSLPTALYALSVLLAAVAYHIGLGIPPPALPDKERIEGVDYSPKFIDAIRRPLGFAMQVDRNTGLHKLTRVIN